MEERMQNTSANANGWPQRDRTASEGYVGVQTYMEIVEGQLVGKHLEGQGLMEQITDYSNLRAAYKQVVSNKGKVGEVEYHILPVTIQRLFDLCECLFSTCVKTQALQGGYGHLISSEPQDVFFSQQVRNQKNKAKIILRTFGDTMTFL